MKVSLVRESGRARRPAGVTDRCRFNGTGRVVRAEPPIRSFELVERRALPGFDDGKLAGMQCQAHIGEGEFDGGAGVAVAGEVREVDSAPTRAGNRYEEFARG